MEVDNAAVRVVDIENAHVAPNGEEIVVRFKDADGTVRLMSFVTTSLGAVVHALAKLGAEATERLHGAGDPTVIYTGSKHVTFEALGSWEVARLSDNRVAVMLRTKMGFELRVATDSANAVEFAGLLLKIAGVADGKVEPLWPQPR